MASETPADDPPRKPGDKFTEKVTVRPFMGGKFLDPHKDLPAYPVTLAKQTGFAIQGGHQYGAGSEIIQADKSVWLVVSAHDNGGEVRFIVKKK